MAIVDRIKEGVRVWRGEFECTNCGHVIKERENNDMRELCPNCNQVYMCDFVIKTEPYKI